MINTAIRTDHFVNRHIGPDKEQVAEMLKLIGVDSIDELIDQTVPSNIRRHDKLNLPEAQSEFNYLKELKKKAAKNKVFRSYIGLGYYGTIVPAAIRRNVLENPGWSIPNTRLTSGRNSSGKAGSIAEFSNHGKRYNRLAHCQCIVTG